MTKYIIRDMLSGAFNNVGTLAGGKFYWLDGKLCSTRISNGLERKDYQQDGQTLSVHQKVYQVSETSEGTGSSISATGPTYNSENDTFTTHTVRSQSQSDLDLIAENSRVANIQADQLYQDVMLLKTSTNAQIKTYIDNNVTDLATARTMLKRVILLLAYVIKKTGA
jgi:hypothetical protein